MNRAETSLCPLVKGPIECRRQLGFGAVVHPFSLVHWQGSYYRATRSLHILIFRSQAGIADFGARFLHGRRSLKEMGPPRIGIPRLNLHICRGIGLDSGSSQRIKLATKEEIYLN